MPGHRRVLLVVHADLDLMYSRRRAGERSGLRLALAEVAPVRVAVAEAAPPGLGHDEDDAGERDGAKAWDGHLENSPRHMPHVGLVRREALHQPPLLRAGPLP